MKPDKEIAIVTSLAPRDFAIQRQAVDSWVENGFKVLSMNALEEIHILKSEFTNVEFVRAERNAADQFGKPYIFFDDVLNYFRKSNARICGIVNSDIYLRRLNETWMSKLYDEAVGSMVYGVRIDVHDLEYRSDGVPYDLGFDFFFFDREILSIYPKEDFCIGLPWWDYWAVLIPMLHGIPTKRLNIPFAYHVKHTVNWKETLWSLFGSKIAFYLGMTFGSKMDRITECANYVLERLQKNTEELVIVPNEIQNKSVCIIYNPKGTNPEDSFTYRCMMEQTLQHKKVVIGDGIQVNLSDIKEDFIWFLEEGGFVSRNFLTLMISEIEDRECMTCALKLVGSPLASNYIYVRYPMEEDGFLQCTLFKNGNLESRMHAPRLQNKKTNHLELGLITLEFNRYMQFKLKKCRNKKIYIFSAGGHTKKLLETVDFKDITICGLLDKNRDLHGKLLYGHTVYDYQSITDLNVDYILISSYSYEREVYEELKESFDENKLIRIYYN